ncbi:(2Fe-2S)-binding protein, partial [Streptomyces sp. MS2A]|nr:(2Fe-2S)-binding protein [Streptomyces sp. MS2A]
LGSEFDASAQKEAICGCTDLSRDELVAEIREKGLTHTKEVMNVLGWKTAEGCSKCRPALNYYLGMINPKEYEDERESRFVNERMHAN